MVSAPHLAMVMICLFLLPACRHDRVVIEACQREDIAPLCEALQQTDEIEAFVYPDPTGSTPDADATAAFVKQVRQAILPERVVEVSMVTGRVLARLDAAALQRAAAVSGARFAPNRFTPTPQPDSSTAREKSP